MKKICNTILTLTLLVFALGCKPEEPVPKPPLTELEKLPPATQKGKDTFGCLVNGKAWRTYSTSDAGGFYQLGHVQIFGETDIQS